MGGLDTKRTALQKHIEELKQFEREYRTRLKAYLESQLRDLHGRGEGLEAELGRTGDVPDRPPAAATGSQRPADNSYGAGSRSALDRPAGNLYPAVGSDSRKPSAHPRRGRAAGRRRPGWLERLIVCSIGDGRRWRDRSRSRGRSRPASDEERRPATTSPAQVFPSPFETGRVPAAVPGGTGSAGAAVPDATVSSAGTTPAIGPNRSRGAIPAQSAARRRSRVRARTRMLVPMAHRHSSGRSRQRRPERRLGVDRGRTRWYGTGTTVRRAADDYDDDVPTIERSGRRAVSRVGHRSTTATASPHVPRGARRRRSSALPPARLRAPDGPGQRTRCAIGEAIELGFTPCALCEPDSTLLAEASQRLTVRRAAEGFGRERPERLIEPPIDG